MTDPADDRLRVAVVGVGAMGAFHANQLTRSVQGARVTVISDPAVARAAQVAEQIPGARVIADPIEAIGADGIDAVLLAGPGATHDEQLRACLARRLPTLCEKPLTTDISAAAGIVAAEQAIGRALIQVGFMRRFDAEYVAARQALAAGTIGRPLLLHCIHRNEAAAAGSDSGTMIRDSLVHEIDVTRYLLDEEITAVRVLKPSPTSAAPAGVDDPLLVILETASGRLADCEVFVRTATGYQVITEVVGESGSVRFGTEHSIQISRADSAGGHTRGSIASGFLDRYAPAYRAELQAWVDAARHGEVAGPGAADGYAAVAVCEAAVQALDTGGRAVPVLGQRASIATDIADDGASGAGDSDASQPAHLPQQRSLPVRLTRGK